MRWKVIMITRVLNEYEMLIENINNNKDISIALKCHHLILI